MYVHRYIYIYSYVSYVNSVHIALWYTFYTYIYIFRDATMQSPLVIREESKEIYIQGISEYCIKNVNDSLSLLKYVYMLHMYNLLTTCTIYIYIYKCIYNTHIYMYIYRIAEDNRAIRETYMNQFSSRSHSIFQVCIYTYICVLVYIYYIWRILTHVYIYRLLWNRN